MKKNLCVFLIALLVAAMSAPARAENDGSQPPGSSRALETPIVASRLDGLLSSKSVAVNPRGGFVDDGYVYVAIHNWHGAGAHWHPRVAASVDLQQPEITFCHDPNGDPKGEQLTLWRQRATQADLTRPWELVGRLSACSEVTDARYPGESSLTITGTIGRGLAAYGGTKFYVTGQRTTCTAWKLGCMNAEFLGAASSPVGLASRQHDVAEAKWRPYPLLALSTLADGRSISFNGFLALESYDLDPSAPWRFGSERQADPEGRPATLWGIARWGVVPFDANLPGAPNFLAAVQIADYSGSVRPNWRDTRAWVLTEDGRWTEAHRINGTLGAAPMNVKTLFPAINKVETLFFDDARGAWMGVGHDTQTAVLPPDGCDDRGLGWEGLFACDKKATEAERTACEANVEAIGNSHSTVVMSELGGSQIQRFLHSTYTQNTHQLGALLTKIEGRIFALRGSTEWVCLERPELFTHAWHKAEVTIEKLP